MQLQDDTPLLRLMMSDMEKVDPLYQPTNYWKNYEKKLVPELLSSGLKDFRRNKNPIFLSLGGADLSPASTINLFKSRLFGNRITKRLPLWRSAVTRLNSLLTSTLSPVVTDGVALDDIRYMCYQVARLQGQEWGARSITDMEASLAGNPADAFQVEDKTYTLSILKYYLSYAYCCRFIDFDKVRVIAELGSGSGKQVEVIKKLHPDICFFLFDIPPQLYVCEQYLRSVFPHDVVSFRETRGVSSLPDPQKGQIFVFGNWKFSLLTHTDLFWNQASLQEMEPDVVANYLQFVDRAAQTAFLCEVMGGKEVAKKPGEHGVLNQTKMKHYKEGLNTFDLLDVSPYFNIPKIKTKQIYSYSFWRRKP